MNGGPNRFPGGMPIPYPAGKEPLPPGFTEEDRPQYVQMKKWEGYTQMASESCAFKTVLAGGAGKHHNTTSSVYHGHFQVFLLRFWHRSLFFAHVGFICL